MRMGSIRMRATLAAGFVGSFTLQLWAQVAPSATPARNPVTGDPRAITQGAVLFRQECVFCHGFGARGGVRGPDLTTGSWSHDLTLQYDAVTAVTADGRTIVGVPMNEDTFTVQLMDTSERVHSLDKKTLKSLRHENRSLMPAYGADRLGNADLDDVIAYLQSLRAPTPVRKRGSSHENP